MKQIRNGVFETNSSSTHSICIENPVKPIEFTSPSCIKLKLQQFYWDYRKVESFEDKVNLLWMAYLIIILDPTNSNQAKAKTQLKELMCFLKRNKIEYEVDCSLIIEDIYVYIDTGIACEIINIFDNYPYKMEIFLISDKSFAIISNDNCEDSETTYIHVDYPANLYGDYEEDEFWK